MPAVSCSTPAFVVSLTARRSNKLIMTVISNHDDAMRQDKLPCTFCGERQQVTRPWEPYLHWIIHEGEALIICGDCAIKCENGLIADIIHCAAATRIHRLANQSNLRRERP